MRRASDRHALRNTITGFVVFGIGLYLHAQDFSEWGTIALMFLGGVLIQGGSIVGLVQAWRQGRQPDVIRRRRDSGREDGVEPTD